MKYASTLVRDIEFDDGVIGHQILLLLCGGDKDRQDRDIRKAKMLWKEYLKSRR